MVLCINFNISEEFVKNCNKAQFYLQTYISEEFVKNCKRSTFKYSAVFSETYSISAVNISYKLTFK